MKKNLVTLLLALSCSSTLLAQNSSKDSLSNLKPIKTQINRLDSANDSLKTIMDEVREDRRYLSYRVNNLFDSLKDAKARIVSLNTANEVLIDSMAALEKTIDKNYAELNEAVENTSSKRQNQVKSLQESVTSNIIYGASAGGFLIVLVSGVFFVSHRMLGSQRQDLETKIDRTRHELEEEAVQMDQKLVQLLESQQQLAQHQDDTENTPDHSLALKVADQIVRIEKNLSRMEADTKGLKQLQNSVKRIKDNFEASGYEMVDLLNQPFDDRMKATIVNTIPDENLKDGERIITRIIKPQVNYNGIMIQPAQVEVSEG